MAQTCSLEQPANRAIFRNRLTGLLIVIFAVASVSSVAFTTITKEGGPAVDSTTIASPAHAETAELVAKVQKAREQIETSDLQKRKILGSIYTIQQRMKKITHEKNTLTDELFHVQDNVRNMAKLIAKLEAEIELQRRQLKRRLSAIYRLSGQSPIALLFSRDNPLDVDESLRNLKIVAEKDYLLIRSYQQNIALYKSHRKKLKVQVEHLVTIESKIKKQEGLLAAEHKQKFAIVSNLDRERVAHIKKIRTLRDRSIASSQINSQIKSQTNSQWSDLLKPSIFEQKGQLPSPIAGVVKRDFGMSTDERYKLSLSHKGWEYSAAAGTPIQSVFDGKVAFADWINGYGLTLIIDHSDHYYTVYSHISRVKVKSGDTLKKGQIIAEAGHASRLYGEGLYFEIRHFSEPENPAQWIGVHEKNMSQVTTKATDASSGNFAKTSVNPTAFG